jgi:hypothetical protein
MSMKSSGAKSGGKSGGSTKGGRKPFPTNVRGNKAGKAGKTPNNSHQTLPGKGKGASKAGY